MPKRSPLMPKRTRDRRRCPKRRGWRSILKPVGVAPAIGKAKEVAGERDVAVNAGERDVVVNAGERDVVVNTGEVGGQIFADGLVDETAMDVVPVVFGSGRRHFGRIDGQHLLEDPHVVIPGERVLRLRFRLRR
jgi:hypothetical protein